MKETILQTSSGLEMQFRFDEKVELAIHKSVRVAVRTFKERRKTALQTGTDEPPPSYETFAGFVENLIESIKRKELNRLRSPDLRELYEKTWSQKLRSYTTQLQLRESYEKLVRRLKRANQGDLPTPR